MSEPELKYEPSVRIPGGTLLRAQLVGTHSPDGYNLEFDWIDPAPDKITPAIGVFAQDDYFEAFLAVRHHLEDDGCELLCKGCAVDVWPSGMSRDMGGGIKAYQMRRGEPASSSSLVDIFEPDSKIQYSRVSTQEKYFQEWLKSLGH